MVESLSHITFIVKNVEKMSDLLRTIFDAEEVYDSSRKNNSESCEKFFIIGNTWIAVIEGQPLEKRSYNHIAFKVSDLDFDKYVSRINQLGLEVKSGRKRVEGEAQSIYFYDYDNHLFELHTETLHERLICYSEE
jgi:catechol 2,3-dioxygenase-like lactoylglutathione lyase family enzyme